MSVRCIDLHEIGRCYKVGASKAAAERLESVSPWRTWGAKPAVEEKRPHRKSKARREFRKGKERKARLTKSCGSRVRLDARSARHDIWQLSLVSALVEAESFAGSSGLRGLLPVTWVDFITTREPNGKISSAIGKGLRPRHMETQ